MDTAPGTGRNEPPEDTTRRWLYGAIGALVAIIAVLGIVWLLNRDDDGQVATGPSSSTTAQVTTTTLAVTTSSTGPTTTTTSTPGNVDTTTAVFPTAASTRRFTDPVAAARAFALDYVGFANPVVGAFQQGDSRSGEVSVKPTANGPTSTVFVRQLGESWWVLGAASADIELTEPKTGAVISSPAALAGRAQAFEGTVQVELRADDVNAPIASTVVTGAMDQKAPFDGTLEFTPPEADGGAIILVTRSAENGEVWQVGASRIRFR